MSPITTGMVCDVIETITCQILAEESMRAPLDAVRMHLGELRIISGDLVTVERLLPLDATGSLALARISGSLVAIHTKRLQPSEAPQS